MERHGDDVIVARCFKDDESEMDQDAAHDLENVGWTVWSEKRVYAPFGDLEYDEGLVVSLPRFPCGDAVVFRRYPVAERAPTARERG